jgi:kindlin 2
LKQKINFNFLIFRSIIIFKVIFILNKKLKMMIANNNHNSTNNNQQQHQRHRFNNSMFNANNERIINSFEMNNQPSMPLSSINTWELVITISDMDGIDENEERRIRVAGDMHIGSVILKLVESLRMNRPRDWSDYSLWWPNNNTTTTTSTGQWLNQTKKTLDQCGVQADAKLVFTPVHKTIRLQLPDLQIIEVKVDFSVRVFEAVRKLCNQIGISHSEEVSLLSGSFLQQNNQDNVTSTKKGSSKRSQSVGKITKTSSNGLTKSQSSILALKTSSTPIVSNLSSSSTSSSASSSSSTTSSSNGDYYFYEKV